MKVPTLLCSQTFDRRSHPYIRGTEPIGIRIITRVVAWPLGLVFMPLLGNRNTGDHDVLDTVLRHSRQQLVHSRRFLEEIDVMQMCIAVGVVTGLGPSTGSRQGQRQNAVFQSHLPPPV